MVKFFDIPPSDKKGYMFPPLKSGQNFLFFGQSNMAEMMVCQTRRD